VLVTAGGGEVGLVEDKYYSILDSALTIGKTCSIMYPEDNSFTFARNMHYLMPLLNVDLRLDVVTHEYLADWAEIKNFSKRISFHSVLNEDNLEYVYTYIHNMINKDKQPAPNIIGNNCEIHETAIIGLRGNTFAFCPDGSRIRLIEVGNVVIGDDVDIDAYSTVHRSCMNSTVIGNGTKICAQVNIGHNCIIGERNLISAGVRLAGETTVGNDCFIWQGVITRNRVKICDNVMIGAGSLVLNDITKPGVYFGSPAKYVKPFNPDLR
jgi:acetyltransferase-like isoleucine patch superfamily enzyme